MIRSLLLLTLPWVVLMARENTLMENLSIPELQIKQPPFAERTADNIHYFLANDDSLPFATVDLYFAGGLDAEPISRAGLLQAMTGLLPVGGAGSLSGDEFSRALSTIGSRLSIQHTTENWQVSLSFLAADEERALSLLEMLLISPRFEEDRLPAIKNKMLAAIKQRNDRPEDIARRKLNELMHPGLRAGYFLREKDVEKIDIKAIRGDYSSRLSRRGLTVALSGHRAEPLMKTVHSILIKIPEQPAMPREVTRFEAIKQPQKSPIILVDVPTARQAVIFMGLHLPGQGHPDFFALQHGNYILGGGSFNSRLMQEIRARRGLAYYAYSANSFHRETGRFHAGAGTRTDSAATSVRLMLEEIEKMQKNVSPAELKLARDAILNSLIFQQDDPARYAQQQVRFYHNGVPQDFLSIFRRRLELMQAETIRSAFRRYVKPEFLQIVVVGPQSLARDLGQIRPVKVVQPD